MLFTLSTLPLLAHLIHTHLFPPIPPNARIYSPVSKSIQNQIPKQNLKQNPSPPSLPKLNTAITVLIPPPLPSPASSSASFPSSSDQTHKPEKPTQDHQNSTPGSSYSAALPAKRANLAGSSCTADTHADIEAGSSSGGTAPESTSTSTPSSSGPISRIRKRAIRLRIQARNILLTLFLSQLCALLSGALLLVLGVTDGSFSQTTALLRIIETVFMVLCVCGFEVAFFRKSLPLVPVSLRLIA
ncbi:hypothetical protein P691DRAFT_812928 [Macrolepiota fuliginosa MF-IS2]|uniref:Uncharacterized protein n=1 Tax=Macrolepiota fuliginosa MF-IS2 TaxID=1400762 RepID=A0A9P6BV66_9AGAR|nr:hypothetical protein P691DRAFT_812928 [Macrolepiota fuliginosa MF-IS2]